MNTYRLYELEKRFWLQQHPGATPEQVHKAFADIAGRLGV